MARTDPQFNLRFPAELKESIELAAKANNRSMNAEMVDRLQNSFQINPQPLTGASIETIKKMLLDQEQHLEEKINNAMSELLKALKP